MGKAKASKAKASAKAAATATTTSSGTGAAASGASGGAASTSAAVAAAEGTDYFSRLTEEEQAAEVKKREERDNKAQAAKKKEEEDRRWREWKEQEQKAQSLKAQRNSKKEDKEMQELIKRAKEEGVMEAVEYEEDGCWYVEVTKDTWKMVEFPWWCKHCEASLNLAVLGAHLGGERHRKSLAWATCPTAAPSKATTSTAGGDVAHIVAAGTVCGVNTESAASGAATAASATGQEWNGTPEPWQEVVAHSGYYRCIPCNKMCDGVHENTDEHKKRVADYVYRLGVEGKEYPAPVQPWLAWVSDSSTGGWRYLKCLLCKKWVQDLGSELTVGYVGNHGGKGPANQKDHAKRLANLEYYLADLMVEKGQWHPPEPSVKIPDRKSVV